MTVKVGDKVPAAKVRQMTSDGAKDINPAELFANLISDLTNRTGRYDVAIAGNGETIIWRLTGKTLSRDAGGGAQPIVDGVRSFGLEYLDAASLPVQVPDEVRTVLITIVTEAVWDVAERSPVTVFSTRVRLRNR